MTLTKTQIKTMLEMQDKLNSVINPDWRAADYPWHRAIMVEAVEALEHYGWKWWKKQKPDLVQAKIELVDIWHFVLSMSLSQNFDLDDTADRALNNFVLPMFSMDSSPVWDKLDSLVAHAAQGRFASFAFRGLMADFGLTWDELYTTYVAKNVLNLFRQAHGYKQGTYIKMWDGQEDNVCLDILMKAKPDATADQLYAKLEQMYATVTVPVAA